MRTVAKGDAIIMLADALNKNEIKSYTFKN